MGAVNGVEAVAVAFSYSVAFYVNMCFSCVNFAVACCKDAVSTCFILSHSFGSDCQLAKVHLGLVLGFNTCCPGRRAVFRNSLDICSAAYGQSMFAVFILKIAAHENTISNTFRLAVGSNVDIEVFYLDIGSISINAGNIDSVYIIIRACRLTCDIHILGSEPARSIVVRGCCMNTAGSTIFNIKLQI